MSQFLKLKEAGGLWVFLNLGYVQRVECVSPDLWLIRYSDTTLEITDYDSIQTLSRCLHEATFRALPATQGQEP